MRDDEKGRGREEYEEERLNYQMQDLKQKIFVF
jgi:hypothetical protein